MWKQVFDLWQLFPGQTADPVTCSHGCFRGSAGHGHCLWMLNSFFLRRRSLPLSVGITQEGELGVNYTLAEWARALRSPAPGRIKKGHSLYAELSSQWAMNQLHVTHIILNSDWPPSYFFIKWIWQSLITVCPVLPLQIRTVDWNCPLASCETENDLRKWVDT